MVAEMLHFNILQHFTSFGLPNSIPAITLNYAGLVRLPELRRFQLLRQMVNHSFGDGIWSIPILAAQLVRPRFEIDNLDGDCCINRAIWPRSCF